jgi:hypothetical protein
MTIVVASNGGSSQNAAWRRAVLLKLLSKRGDRDVRELLKTNDPVLISLVEAVLSGQGIPVLVADQHMSALEGSIGVLPRRLLVPEDDLFRARVLVANAGVPHEQLTVPRAPANGGYDV